LDGAKLKRLTSANAPAMISKEETYDLTLQFIETVKKDQYIRFDNVTDLQFAIFCRTKAINCSTIASNVQERLDG
jgi:hypothetical protein